VICPHSLEVVGDSCERRCWLRHWRAQAGCTAIDAGTTTLTHHDVARVRKKTAAEAAASVDRGRKKLALWMRLVRTLEDVKPSQDTSLDERVREVMAALPLRDVSESATVDRVRTLVADYGVLVSETLSKLGRVG